MDLPRTIERFQAKRKLSNVALAYELHVTEAALRHWKQGTRAPKLWSLYRAWSFYKSAVAGALLAELMPEFRQAITEAERSR